MSGAPTLHVLRSRGVAKAWRRALARALDALTVFFILWALAVMQLVWVLEQITGKLTPAPWGRAFTPTVLFAVGALAHEAFFVRNNHGQTPGMDVCRVRVVALDGLLDTRRCLLRAAPAALLWIVPPLWLGGLLAASTGLPGLGAEGRSLQDRLAHTRVVPYDRPAEDPDCPPAPVLFRWRRSNESGPFGPRSAR